MNQGYDLLSERIAHKITRHYSTSFSIGTRLLGKDVRRHVYSIYGFVRIADEIVDSYSGADASHRLDRFEEEYYRALETGLSFNPVIHAFVQVVRKFDLKELNEHFLSSMRMDLDKKVYADALEYEKYILGSAEVVGLMCLRVFVGGDEATYRKLEPAARKLGSAFQKVNFLRDLKQDFHELGRVYFPGLDINAFGEYDKKKIIKEISEEFDEALEGIRQLPSNARLGVLVAYNYYRALLRKLDASEAMQLLQQRIRVSNTEKAFLLMGSLFRYTFNTY